MSPKLESELEALNYSIQMAQFDPKKHLKEREEQYVHGINDYMEIVRETEDGWWRESLDFKGDPAKQIEKLKNDKTVVVGWLITHRFRGNGGWS